MESAPSFQIIKKLKLVGYPKQVFKNTAFIQGMFTSDLEVAKCSGAKIQTVSGIRGQIKAAQGKDGVFRATFEDKLLMSDIVLCKAWIRVTPKQFYNPVRDTPTWRRIRTMGELRNAHQVPIPFKKDSEYGAKPVRFARKFNPLRLPKTLVRNLPFASLPKEAQPRRKNKLALETKVVLSPYEKKVADLFSRLHTIRKERIKTRNATRVKRQAQKSSLLQKEEAKREAKRKEIRKKRHAKEGRQESIKRRKLRLSSE